jgi:LDH2 family malate/lactate/ureidoglycolate dehydrogenase
MMVECLAGALGASVDAGLPGRDRLPESGAVGRQGGFLWLVRPAAFGEAAAFESAMTAWTDGYLDAGTPDARLPGARGAALEARGRVEGLTLPAAIVAELSSLGGRLGLPFPVG